MKDIKELNPRGYKTNPTIEKNLEILYHRLLELQDALYKDLVITSGLRSDEKQAALIAAGKTTAVHSKHCAGAAADILDTDGSISEWVRNNLSFMERIGFWMEDFDSIEKLAEIQKCSRWLHVQIMAPKSGKRVFIP